jgi:alpha-L-fucosidase 2
MEPSDALGNIALLPNAIADQSSTIYGAVASRAIDGDTSGHYGDASVTATGDRPGSTNPYWRVRWPSNDVNTGAILRIVRIKVWNRTDCCKERLNGFILTIYSRGLIVWSSTTSTVNTSITATSYDFIDIPEIIYGDEVKVALLGNNKMLSLAEVEVFGRVLVEGA